jgi:hypothetical protein
MRDSAAVLAEVVALRQGRPGNTVRQQTVHRVRPHSPHHRNRALGTICQRWYLNMDVEELPDAASATSFSMLLSPAHGTVRRLESLARRGAVACWVLQRNVGRKEDAPCRRKRSTAR